MQSPGGNIDLAGDLGEGNHIVPFRGSLFRHRLPMVEENPAAQEALGLRPVSGVPG